MLETSESLLPLAASKGKLRVLAVGIQNSGSIPLSEGSLEEPALEELIRLLDTLGVETVSSIQFSVRRVSASTYIGKGQAEEVRTLIESSGAEAVAVDQDLSPNQLRNLEKAFGKPTLDRSGVIIEIFSKHARTKEAKTQVELARLQYLMPRLTHFWTHFERQRGGIGLKGMGESQLEVDRRLLKKRMKLLRGRLSDIEKEREVQRSGRSGFLKVALVGYTNAGKSTLLNALTRSEVRAEDKLFATLDSSVRALNPDSHPPVVAIDTVGFISRIPPDLIASFRSTLEEAFQADLLVHVVDASSPNARIQFEVTERILGELGLDKKPRLAVLNKIDRIGNVGALNWARLASPGAAQISALNPVDVEKLRQSLLQHFKNGLEVWEVMIPYEQSRLMSQLSAYGDIERTKYLDQGVFCRVRISAQWAQKLDLARYKP